MQCISDLFKLAASQEDILTRTKLQLVLNPENYTAWNRRKEAIVEGRLDPDRGIRLLIKN
jgi:hypothetical protein